MAEMSPHFNCKLMGLASSGWVAYNKEQCELTR